MSVRVASLRHSERGATLIELMIAMLVASILIGMVLSVYTRLSVGYRAQSKVSDLQQSLRAAKIHMVQEIRAAGHMMPNGVMVNGNPNPVQPIVVVNDIAPGDATFGPDKITLYYADTSAMAAVTGHTTPITSITVDDLDNFSAGELVVVVNQRTVVPPAADLAPIAEYDTCLLAITNMVPATSTIEFDVAGAPFNSADNLHCTAALDMSQASPPMLYRFKARSYRIDPDPANRALGILQTSPSGELVGNDWQTMGVGFTNLQFAIRYYEAGNTVDRDNDGDPTRDWYSGTPPPGPPSGAVPYAATVSLEIRSRDAIDLVPTDATPRFIEAGAADARFNRVGDWESVQLGGVADAARPEQYRSNHIYRWSTTTVDIRNMGVGR